MARNRSADRAARQGFLAERSSACGWTSSQLSSREGSQMFERGREVRTLPVLPGRAKVMHQSDSASNKIGNPKQEKPWQMQFIHVLRTASKATSSYSDSPCSLTEPIPRKDR
jgi:hypothetical protein